MTVGLTANSRHRELHPRSGPVLRAEVGDTLIIGTGGLTRIPRIGEIIAVASGDGKPPYRVHWLSGEYESVIFPGPGARIEKSRRAGAAAPLPGK